MPPDHTGSPSSPGHPCPHPLATHVRGHSHFLRDHPGIPPPAPRSSRGSVPKARGAIPFPESPQLERGSHRGCAGSGHSRGSPGCSGIVWTRAWPAWCPRGKTDQNNSAQHPFKGSAQAEGNSKDVLMSAWRGLNVETAPGCSEVQE